MKRLPVTRVRFLRALPLVAVAALGAYGLIASAGALGVVLLLAILVLAGAVAVWARGTDVGAQATIRRTATAALLSAPAILVVFFSFSSGGFFPDSVALGTLAVGVLLIVRLAIAERPLASFGRAALVPLIGLAGLAGWALLSQFWSHAPGRATIGFDRDLLYALTFALFASLGSTRERLTWAVRAVAFAMAAVAALSLVSRVAPDVLATSIPPNAGGRLAYPLTYWNALGVFCAVAAVLALHLAASDGRRVLCVVAAGALPVLGATLLFTYSRGGLLVAVIGLAVYAVLGRPRGLISALIATAPGTAIAMHSAYDATLLSGANPTSPAAVHQGHHVALVVLGCVASAVVLRALLFALDAFLEGDRSPIDRHRPELRGAALAAAIVAVIVAIALGAPGAIAHRWDQFVNQQTPQTAPLTRSRSDELVQQRPHRALEDRVQRVQGPSARRHRRRDLRDLLLRAPQRHERRRQRPLALHRDARRSRDRRPGAHRPVRPRHARRPGAVPPRPRPGCLRRAVQRRSRLGPARGRRLGLADARGLAVVRSARRARARARLSETTRSPHPTPHSSPGSRSARSSRAPSCSRRACSRRSCSPRRFA